MTSTTRKNKSYIRQIKQHGLANTNHLFQLTMIDWNLIRISNLQERYA